MSYSLYFHPSLVAPTLLKNNIHQKGEHNGKIFLVGAAQIDFPDPFPTNVDPSWKIYPKENWYPGINLANPNVVWTRIEAEGHYLMYIPISRDPEILAYKALLKEYVFKELLREINRGKRIDYTTLLNSQQKRDSAEKRKKKRNLDKINEENERKLLATIRKKQATDRASRAAARNK